MTKGSIKFDKRKSCYFEINCKPFGIQPVYIPSDAYEMSMIKKRLFKFIGPITKIEMGHKLNKAGLRQTEKDVQNILPLWNAIWPRSLAAVHELRKKWDYEPFASGDEFDVWIMPRDNPKSDKKFVVELIADGRWYVELDKNLDILDSLVVW